MMSRFLLRLISNYLEEVMEGYLHHLPFPFRIVSVFAVNFSMRIGRLSQ